MTLMVLSDDPLTIRVSSNWTQEIPCNNKRTSVVHYCGTNFTLMTQLTWS